MNNSSIYARQVGRRLRGIRPSVLCAVIGVLPLAVSGQASSTNNPGIMIGLAKHVATEHVRANNRPYQWHYLDHMVVFDIDGNPTGYAFIFGKDGSRFSGPAILRQHIADHSTKPEKQGEVSTSADDSDLFVFDDLATVITGATTESPLIWRHFRGAPEFWIEAVRLDAAGHAGSNGAIQVVMVTPMDFRLVSTSSKAATVVAESDAQVAAIPLEDSIEVISVNSKKAERICALRQQAQDREARNRKRIESMTPEQKQQHEAAQQGRKDFLISQWAAKRALWDNATSQEAQQ